MRRWSFFESADHIRMRQGSPTNRGVTAIEILNRFGGYLPDLVEEGVLWIPPCS